MIEYIDNFYFVMQLVVETRDCIYIACGRVQVISGKLGL